MTICYVALGSGIMTGIVGQMLLKAGADAPDFVSQVLRPSTLCGLALYGSAAFLYLVALRKIPVSVAFPSVSLSYAVVAGAWDFPFRRALRPQPVRGPPPLTGRGCLIQPASGGG